MSRIAPLKLLKVLTLTRCTQREGIKVTDDSYRINDLQSQIDALRHERDEWKEKALNVRNTIGHCFLPNEYHITCQDCFNAVREIDKASGAYKDA